MSFDLVLIFNVVLIFDLVFISNTDSKMLSHILGKFPQKTKDASIQIFIRKEPQWPHLDLPEYYSVLNSSNDIRNPIKSNSIFNGRKELIKNSNLHQRNHCHADLKPTVTALSPGSKPTADWNYCHSDLNLNQRNYCHPDLNLL